MLARDVNALTRALGTMWNSKRTVINILQARNVRFRHWQIWSRRNHSKDCMMIPSLSILYLSEMDLPARNNCILYWTRTMEKDSIVSAKIAQTRYLMLKGAMVAWNDLCCTPRSAGAGPVIFCESQCILPWLMPCKALHLLVPQIWNCTCPSAYTLATLGDVGCAPVLFLDPQCTIDPCTCVPWYDWLSKKYRQCIFIGYLLTSQ